jgi:hypothetical protein
MTENARTETDIENRVARAIADALGEETFYAADGFQNAARAAISAHTGGTHVMVPKELLDSLFDSALWGGSHRSRSLKTCGPLA